MAPEVSELPAVIQNEVSALAGAEIDEALLSRIAEGIAKRVANAGFPDQATALLRRMGRAMYELLLLMATEEELRTMGMLLEAAVQPSAPPSPINGNLSARPQGGPAATAPAVAAAHPAPPRSQVAAATFPRVSTPPAAREAQPTARTGLAAPSGVSSTRPPGAAPAVRKPASETRSRQPGDVPESETSSSPPSVVTNQSPAVGPTSAAASLPVSASSPTMAASQPSPAIPPEAVTNPPAPASPPEAVASLPAPDGPPKTVANPPAPDGPPEAVASLPTAPAVPITAPLAGDRGPSTIPTDEAPTVASSPNPIPEPAAGEGSQAEQVPGEDAALWGFNPAERESPTPAPDEILVRAGDEPEPGGPALVVESRSAPDSGESPADPAPDRSVVDGGPLTPGWAVRLSPKMARERERRLRKRTEELSPLIGEIVAQVHEQRRAVSDRGLANTAVRSAAEQSAPGELSLAETKLWEMLDGDKLTEAAALVLRAAEAFPGERSAELACRAGEAAREAKDEPLATLCLTTAVLAAPPCETACWQLAGMARESRDPRLAPIWMEFLARLLRVRGADEDAVVVYRQLLNLTPRRQDVRDILRVASLTGVLPD